MLSQANFERELAAQIKKAEDEKQRQVEEMERHSIEEQEKLRIQLLSEFE